MSDPISLSGLQFFGTIAASISHEIKNRMAIINEQAGLLEDFVEMAKNGRPLDSQRLERLAAAVKTQVSLTDGIIKNMNQFAHSVDQISNYVDLGELLGLMEALFKRKISSSGVNFEVKQPETSLTAKTSPFLLMNLIWQCLSPILTEKRAGQNLCLSCDKQDGNSVILIELDQSKKMEDLVLSEMAQGLAESIEATLVLNLENNMLKIELPAKPVKSSSL